MTGGVIKVTAKYNEFVLYTGTLKVCNTVKTVGLQCPISAGPGHNSTTITIPGPSLIPNVSFAHITILTIKKNSIARYVLKALGLEVCITYI